MNVKDFLRPGDLVDTKDYCGFKVTRIDEFELRSERISRHDGELMEEDIVQWKDGAWFIDAGVFCGSQHLGSYKAECLEVLG